jgi:3-phosphoshikimate 1-carboxyvinyltransferase
VKESDRIRTVVELLRAVGADAEELDDGFVVRGQMSMGGGEVHSHGDHRLAMLGALAGIASQSGVTVHGMEAAAVSYPGFTDDLVSLGAVTA